MLGRVNPRIPAGFTNCADGHMTLGFWCECERQREMIQSTCFTYEESALTRMQ